MSNNTTVTVVLTTYNGEQFIGEQLSSILEQTRLPDELVILDDCSCDRTVDIISHMIRNVEDLQCRLVINEQNKGWRRNFIDGFHLASGDIIFCADQDDIWEKNKIELMTDALKNNANINVLACNLTPLYEAGAKKLAGFYVEKYGNDHIAPVRLSDRGFTVLRPGCTICFRRSIMNWVDRIWDEKLAHDEVLWAIGLVTDSLCIINEPLIRFRRHSNNNSPSNEKRIAPRLNRAECDLEKAKKIIDESDELNISKENQQFIRDQLSLSVDRVKAFQDRSLWEGLLLIKHINKYSSIKAWIADILCLING